MSSRFDRTHGKDRVIATHYLYCTRELAKKVEEWGQETT